MHGEVELGEPKADAQGSASIGFTVSAPSGNCGDARQGDGQRGKTKARL
ncbi:MAG: hypothetical protein BLITH_1465 [Brockia lithotrophica]|uniref:Uncharacterized protein n=1 Tax=Brockia lithotrophica TaxID=933949 RepID=A0A2T5G5D2_9BACL|nr:MAG: hypothetical protein BLITH_1465 [Brockia lithotrophica]